MRKDTFINIKLDIPDNREVNRYNNYNWEITFLSGFFVFIPFKIRFAFLQVTCLKEYWFCISLFIILTTLESLLYFSVAAKIG